MDILTYTLKFIASNDEANELPIIIDRSDLSEIKIYLVFGKPYTTAVIERIVVLFKDWLQKYKQNSQVRLFVSTVDKPMTTPTNYNNQDLNDNSIVTVKRINAKIFISTGPQDSYFLSTANYKLANF